MNARGTLNGEEALESGYRIYYSAPEDTIDGVAAAIGVNANELYSWNVPFYDEGELPRSGTVERKRLVCSNKFRHIKTNYLLERSNVTT